MTAQEQQIKNDCTILLERALFGRLVCAFGEDGCGQYGRSDTPAFFLVKAICVEIGVDSSNHSVLTGKAWLHLDGYNSIDNGYILTDKNFEISIRKLLVDESIDPQALTWGDFNEQGADFVVMKIDIDQLLN